MPKKNDAWISSKSKTPIPAIPIFNYFVTLKNYHANKYTFWGYIVMYMIALYTLNYYEDKYFFNAGFKYTVKIYTPNFTHFIRNKHK